VKVLVDTCVWSQALRHKNRNEKISTRLKELIKDGRVVMMGPIRQELLSGISDEVQFEALREHLSSFEDLVLTSHHYIQAAEFSNRCRKKGVQGSTTDFLICSVSVLEELEVFTTDADFNRYEKILPIRLGEPEGT
jgi:predicted nucleic acid-binding protein